MSDAHIPSTLGAQSATEASHRPPFQRRRRAKRAPRVLQRTHTDHASSAGGEQSDPHAFSNAHITTTLRAQAAERSEPHAVCKAHIPSTFRAQKAPRIFQSAPVKHPSGAGEPHAFSDPHVSSTLQAHVACEASPTRFPRHTHQITLRAQAASERSPTLFPNAHLPTTL